MNRIQYLLLSMFTVFISAGCRQTVVVDKDGCYWKKEYIIQNSIDCMRAKYGCSDDEKIFGDSNGCGCMKKICGSQYNRK